MTSQKLVNKFTVTTKRLSTLRHDAIRGRRRATCATYPLVKIDADAGEGVAGRALSPVSFARASHGEVLVKGYAGFGALVASTADLLQQCRRYATVIASLSD